jgi:hypothetical protein
VTEPRFSSYDEFFAFYLREHSNPRNRLMHAIGTVLGLCTLILPIVIGHPWFALVVAGCGLRLRLDRAFPDGGQQAGDIRPSVLVIYQRF